MLSINEVGIPWHAARELTIPIRVTNFNVEIVKELVLRGPEPHNDLGEYIPGVNYVIREDGRRIKVTDTNSETVSENVDVGQVVERQLTDGDIVLFNRQPSLHRMSMMAHKIRVMKGKTFRFQLCDCPPYNADFDGDEMNLHVLQSPESISEGRILMLVQENILSPRFGGPVIGGIHDYISGSFFLTHKNPLFTQEEASLILSRIGMIDWPEPMMIDGEKLWSGKDLFSLSLPDELNLTYKSSICRKCDVCKKTDCDIDAYVTIRDGKLITGTIDEKALGAFKGLILDKIARDMGTDDARIFLEMAIKMAVSAIMIHGFSTSIDDEDIPIDARKQIEVSLEDAAKKVRGYVDAYNDGTLEAMPGRSLNETLEVEAMRVLGQARDDAGQIANRYLGLENSAVIMARSGARGSMLNLSQMAGCIGQQAVRGGRLSRGYQDRTLPHFQKGDLGAEAKGFVKNCYKSGLAPTEYFFHSMGGREGLVDTAVRTSRSGYMQRRLINALEDLKVMQDGSVRNTAGTIIQFKFGEDGIDPSRSINGKAANIDDILFQVLGDDSIDTDAPKHGTTDTDSGKKTDVDSEGGE